MEVPPPRDFEDRWLCRVGGLSALALAGAYVAIFFLYARVGAPPSGDGAEWLAYLAGRTTIWWAILGLSVLTDILFIPVALGLYVALSPVRRGPMRLAGTLVGLFVALDLAVTWTQYATMLTLAGRHAAAGGAAERAAYVAAAHGAAALLASPLLVVYAIVVLSTGILIIGLVMRTGVFGRTTAGVAVLTGLSGIASLTRYGPLIIANAMLATVWLALVGARLTRLARS